jgi:arylsulfatase A-like enzyme
MMRWLFGGRAQCAPFFMYVAFNAPHDPRQAPQSFVDRYPVSRVTVPADYLPEYPHAEQMGAGRGLRDEKLAPFPRTERAVKVHRGEYFALITHLDEQIGRVLAALDEVGKGGTNLDLFHFRPWVGGGASWADGQAEHV